MGEGLLGRVVDAQGFPLDHGGPVQDVVQNPLHPYARGLMGAIPTLAHDADRLVQIPGAMPRLSAIPPGCPFNPRCPRVTDKCRHGEPPPLDEVAADHLSRCWYAQEVRSHGLTV